MADIRKFLGYIFANPTTQEFLDKHGHLNRFNSWHTGMGGMWNVYCNKCRIVLVMEAYGSKRVFSCIESGHG